MSSPPPVIALSVPMLGWYTVRSGGIEVSMILSVPNSSYLSSPDGVNVGLEGVADGVMIHLAGFVETSDGGQNWYMWVADSLDTPDDSTVFNPYPSNSTPGRWIVQTLTTLPVVAPLIYLSGATITLPGGSGVAVIRKTVGASTTVNLPANALAGTTWTVKDGKGDCSTNNITVRTTDGSLIDGLSTVVLSTDYQSYNFESDGTNWIML